jgi:SAM-dependent methyltransferase
VSTGEYDRLDAELYDAYTGASIDGDVEFYVEEARRAGSPVLELGCGTGRILMPVAMAGIDVVGLDRAPNMLAVAGEKRAALEPDVRRRIALIEGDMRSFSLGQRFSLVMIPFRAFLHLLTVDDQRQTLASVRDHLAPDGHLALNIFDPDLSIIQARQGVHAGTLQSFIFQERAAAGRVGARLYAPLMLRWVYRYEMQHLLELAGFRIEALYGDFRRGPFRHGGEQVWIARKA